MVQKLSDVLQGAKLEHILDSDNLFVAVLAYFSGHRDRPTEEVDPNTGVTPWIMDKTRRFFVDLQEEVEKFIADSDESTVDDDTDWEDRYDDARNDLDEANATIYELESAISRMIAHAGMPDSAEGCRAVIATGKEALGK